MCCAQAVLVLLCRLLGLFEVGTKQWPSAASGPQLLTKLSSLGQDISLQVLAALGMTMAMGGGVVHLVWAPRMLGALLPSVAYSSSACHSLMASTWHTAVASLGRRPVLHDSSRVRTTLCDGCLCQMEDPTTDLTGLLTIVQTLHGTLGQPATPGGAGTAPIAARFQVVLADAAAATARVNAQTASVGSPHRAALRLRTLLAGMLARLGSARREVARLEAELATCVTAMRADGGPSAAGGAGSGGGASPSGVTRAEASYVHCFIVVRNTRMRLANRRCLFFPVSLDLIPYTSQGHRVSRSAR
jgi:hypothetical protein